MTFKGRAREFEQVGNSIDGKIGGRKGADDLSIQRELALPYEYGRDPVAPGRLDRREYTDLVVDQHVAVGRISPLDVVEGELLVDVDQDMTIDGFGDAG